MKLLHRLVRTDCCDAGMLAVRVALGVVIFPHGAQKALGWFGGGGVTGTVEFFRNVLGVPAPLTMLVIAAEFLGAMGLVVGLFSRVAAAGIAAVMLGAVFMVHWKHGFFMNWYGNQSGEGFEFHLLAIGMAVAVIIRGSGAWSLDGLVGRRLSARGAPSAG